MARARQVEKDPAGEAATRLLTPAELVEVQGEGPLRAAYADLWTAHQQVRQRVEELERQAGLHSRNSGKPPPTDGLAKPPVPKKEPPRSGRAASGGRPAAPQAASPTIHARRCGRPSTRTRSRPTGRRSAPGARTLRWERPQTRSGVSGVSRPSWANSPNARDR